MTNPLTDKRLAEIKARCKAATEGKYKTGHARECTMGWQYRPAGSVCDCGLAEILSDLPDCHAEIKRLKGAVEASKDCGLIDGNPCPYPLTACEKCEHNGYPDAVRKALEQE